MEKTTYAKKANIIGVNLTKDEAGYNVTNEIINESCIDLIRRFILSYEFKRILTVDNLKQSIEFSCDLSYENIEFQFSKDLILRNILKTLGIDNKTIDEAFYVDGRLLDDKDLIDTFRTIVNCQKMKLLDCRSIKSLKKISMPLFKEYSLLKAIEKNNKKITGRTSEVSVEDFIIDTVFEIDAVNLNIGAILRYARNNNIPIATDNRTDVNKLRLYIAAEHMDSLCDNDRNSAESFISEQFVNYFITNFSTSLAETSFSCGGSEVDYEAVRDNYYNYCRFYRPTYTMERKKPVVKKKRYNMVD